MWIVTNFVNDTDSEFIGTMTVQDSESGFSYTDRVDVSSDEGREKFKVEAVAQRDKHASITTKRDAIIAQMLAEMNKG